MPPPIPLPPRRVTLAFVLAGVTDAVQLPLNLALVSGVLAVPVLTAEVVLDLVAAVAAVRLLGFHWLLLPSCLLELVPVVDTLPTWTACVGFVVWQRHRRLAAPRPPPLLPAAVVPALETPAVVLPATSPEPPAAAPPEAVVIDVTPVAGPEPPRPPQPLVRSREGLVIAALVLPALLLVAWLVQGLRRPDPPAGPSRLEQMAQLLVESAQRRVDNARQHCEQLTRDFEELALPGEEPDWFWHPIDHYAWATRKKAWEKARQVYHEKLAEAERTRREAEAELAQIGREMAALTASPEVVGEMKSVWQRYVAPALHALFAFSLLRFSLRAVFRFLLLKDRVGAVRL